MVISTALGAASLFIAILIAKLVYRKSPVDEFSAAFSNAGFMGIPLVRACFGDDAVFFLIGFVALLNLLQWTYGASILSHGKARMGIKQILLNPICISLITGIILFVTGLGAELPDIVLNAVKGISGLNGPIAMLVLGIYLGQTELKSLLIDLKLYKLSLIRLILIPTATLLLLWLLPVDKTMALTVLIAACAPVGSNVAVYAQLYNEDYPYACKTVALSTVLSVLSMPIILAMGGALL